jgi:hypothetical protein
MPSSTEKVSVTIGRDELRQAQKVASRLGLSLSSFINGAVRERIEAHARWQAGMEIISTFAPEELPTEREEERLLALWGPKRVGRSGKGGRARGRAAPRARPRRG